VYISSVIKIKENEFLYLPNKRRMIMKQVRTGQKFNRRMGNVISHVTVTGRTANGRIACVTATGKEFVAKKETVLRWDRVEAKKSTTRLNKTSFVNVLIDTLGKTNTPMTAGELVEKIQQDNSFKFKAGVKTPINSASSRLNSYIKAKGNNALVKKVTGQVGKFVHV
jgi:hypothetical protein